MVSSTSGEHILGDVRTREVLDIELDEFDELDVWLHGNWDNFFAANPDTQPLDQRTSFENFRQQVEAQVSDRLYRMANNMPIAVRNSTANQHVHGRVPVIREPDQSVTTEPVGVMPENNDDFLETHDRGSHMRGGDMKHRRGKLSISSTSSHHSRVSDRLMEDDERSNRVNLFIHHSDRRGSGEHMPGIINTGHTARASLLTQRRAREVGWKPDNNHGHKANDVVGINGSEVEVLGQIECLVEVKKSDYQTFDKMFIIFHVVPDNTFDGDCLLNLKLGTRFPILMLYWLSTKPSYSFMLPYFELLCQAARDQKRSTAAERYQKARSIQPANQ